MTASQGPVGGPAAPRSVIVLTAGLVAAAIGMTVGATAADRASLVASRWAIVPLLVPLVVAALLRVRYYYRGQVEAIDLVETVLAPALLLFPAWLVVASVVASKGIAQIVLRIRPVKAVFNVAQWAASAAVGCVIVASLGSGGSIGRRLAVVGVALAAVIVVNHTAVTVVLALATRQTLRQVLTGLAPVISSGWAGAGLLNMASGLLLTAAAAETAWVTPLALVPLAGLYFAERYLVVAKLDRERRHDFRQANQAFADDHTDLGQALGSFLAATADCFRAGGAELMVEHEQSVDICTVDAGPERSITTRRVDRTDGRAVDSLVEALLAVDDTVWIQAQVGEPGLAGRLAEAGRRGCLAARVRPDPSQRGVMCVYDPQLVGGREQTETATLGVLAGEVTQAYRRAALDHSVHDQHQRFGRLLAGQADVLESVAKGGNLSSTMATLAALLEQAIPGCRTTITLDAIPGEGSPVPARLVAGNGPPSVPESIRDTVNGKLPNATASEPVVVEDVCRASGDRYPAWDGLRSWWALPVLNEDGDHVAGVVAVAHPDCRQPELSEREMLAGAAHLARLALERGLSEARLAEQARLDSLTGLANRRAFLHAVERAVAGRHRTVGDAMVLYLDLDRFKFVNDSFGHDVGDKLLVEVARRIQSVVRPTDVTARLGGDEYAVLSEGLSAIQGLDQASRVLAALNAPITVEGAELVVTASIGLAFGGGHVPAQTLIEHADAAMYRAKERGRNCIELFDPDLVHKARTRLSIRAALLSAVENHEFRVLYQPVVAVSTGELLGVEALVRWRQPGGQLAVPASFIDAAEECGVIVPLGLQVLEEACRQAMRWRSAGAEPFTVSVNMSARQIVDADVVDDVSRILGETGVDPSTMILEITESVLMEAGESTTTLQRLKALGIGLAVDDFGTGYSSLSYLKRFPIDGLKVDRSFVEGLGVNSEDSVIVAAVINLAHTLGLAAVAEGVETSAQLRDLRNLGCEAAQGFHLGRPVPPDRLALAPS